VFLKYSAKWCSRYRTSVQPAVLLLMTVLHFSLQLTVKYMTHTITLTLSCRFLRSLICCPTHGPMQLEGAGQYWMLLILRLRGVAAASLGLLDYTHISCFCSLALCFILLCFALIQSESPMFALDWAYFQRNVAHPTEGTCSHVSMSIETYSINYGSDWMLAHSTE
jgi:hypothetical protein